MLNTIKRIFGTRNDRELKQMKPILDGINKLESHMQKLSDEELRAQTTKFREMIKNIRVSKFLKILTRILDIEVSIKT